MQELISIEEARKVVAQATEKYKTGDVGAPFERPVLKAVLCVAEADQAEFQRLKAELTESGVSSECLSLQERTHSTGGKSGLIMEPFVTSLLGLVSFFGCESSSRSVFDVE